LKALGRHILAEFFDCDAELLKNTDLIEKHMNDAAIKCGATVVQSAFHTFNPYGVSGVVVISESHLTIHTWPELNYAAVDVFTCGDTVDPWVACNHLKELLKSTNVDAVELNRGELKKDEVIHQNPMIIAEDHF
jgi:S-adenosylmethionine decarboxylase proenzyme